MSSSHRTQADRSAATRTALIEAARPLFGERGYAAVGTVELARAAGVTRGALYHQFADKRDLFRGVVEAVEVGLMERIGAAVADAGEDPLTALLTGADVLLRAGLEPGIHQIILIDAPSVLGWEEWREIGERYGLGLIVAVLTAAAEQGFIAPQPVPPLAHMLLGAIDEGMLYVSREPDTAAAHAETIAALRALLDGLRA